MSAFNSVPHQSSKGHSNLQALQVLGNCVKSLLGPTKVVKCVLDEESSEGALLTSTHELLETLAIEHPVGQLVRETSLSQHKAHGSGCTTLVTLSGLWAGHVQSLLTQGVPIHDIISVGDIIIQDCKELAQTHAIPLKSLPRSSSRDGSTRRKQQGRGGSHWSVQTQCDVESGKTQDGIESSRISDDRLTVGLESSSDGQSLRRGAVRVEQTFEELGDVSGDPNTPRQDEGLNESHDRMSSGMPHADITNAMKRMDIPQVKSTTMRQQDEDIVRHASDLSPLIPRVTAVTPQKMNAPEDLLHDDDDVDDVSWFFDDTPNSEDSATTKPKWQDQDIVGDAPVIPRITAVTAQKINAQEDLLRDGDDDVSWFFEDESYRSRGMDEIHKPLCINDVDEQTSTCKEQLAALESDKLSSIHSEGTTVKSIAPSAQGHTQADGSHTRPALLQEPTNSAKNSQSSPTQMNVERIQLLLRNAMLQKPPKRVVGSRIASRHLCDSGQAGDIVDPDSTGMLGRSHLAFRTEQQSQDAESDRLDLSSPDNQRHELGRQVQHDLGREEYLQMPTLSVGLAHGADVEMKLAAEVCQMQMSSHHHRSSAFTPEKVHIQTISGPPTTSSQTVRGLVLPISASQLQTLQRLGGSGMRALLLNSDVQVSYRHRGFKTSLKSSVTVSSSVPSVDDSFLSKWIDTTVGHLMKCDVNLLLVKGSVASSLVESCSRHQIMIVEHVPYSALQILAAGCKTSPLAYPTDAVQEDVCTDVRVCYWSSGYQPHPTVRSTELKMQHYIRLACPGDVMTIVLCAPCEPILIGVEQRVRSCLARLRSALHDGQVLPGAGHLEHLIADDVSQKQATGEQDVITCHYRRLIREALSQGLMDYSLQIRLSQGLGPHPSPSNFWEKSEDADGCVVYDCLAAKTGAWERAWHLVKQVLLCDALIVTGITKGERSFDTVL